MRNNPEGSELDPAVDDRRHCKKNFPSILSCIGERIKKAVTVVANSEQFTPEENRRNLTKKRIVREMSSPDGVVSVLSLQ